ARAANIRNAARRCHRPVVEARLRRIGTDRPLPGRTTHHAADDRREAPARSHAALPARPAPSPTCRPPATGHAFRALAAAPPRRHCNLPSAAGPLAGEPPPHRPPRSPPRDLGVST